MGKWLLNVYILYLYVQTIIRQCFCFPNSQWGATAHDKTIILSSMTACDATAMTLPLYSVNLLLSSVHPSLKQ